MARYSRNWPPFVQALVVLCIIAFMTAILFPVFQKVHESNGPRRSCTSNLAQLGLALTQYTQDSDNMLPSGMNTAGNGWAGSLYPFIQSTSTYHCPDDPSNPPSISYAENRNIVRQPLARCPNPNSTVAFYEATTLNCDPSHRETVSLTGLMAPQDSTRHASVKSPFGLYFLFLDDHAKYLAPNQVSSGPNAVSIQPVSQGALEATFALK